MEITAERVSQIITGINKIGHAKRLLELDGHTAVISGNRLTINNRVEAHLCGVNGHTWWDVWASDGTPPMFTVGAQADQGSWVGAD